MSRLRVFGQVGEEVVDDGGGRRRMKIIENPDVQERKL